MLEIEVLLCARARCKDPKDGASGQLFMCFLLYEPIENLGKTRTHRIV